MQLQQRQQQQDKSVKTKELLKSLRESGYSVDQLSRSGVSAPAIYKYLSEEGINPREETLEALRSWLGIPKKVFNKYFAGSITVTELLSHKGQQIDLQGENYSAGLSFFSALSIENKLKFLGKCNSLLAEELLKKPKAASNQPFSLRERIRLRNLLRNSLLLSGSSEEELYELTGYSSIVPNTLELDIEYQYPDSDLSALIPHLYQVYSWESDNLPIINPSKKLDSLEGLFEALRKA